MKQKKQIKIIISLLVMVAVLFGGWGLMKQEGLSAKNKEETETKSVRAVPTPPNANIVNVSDNFTIVGSGIAYPEWTNTVSVTTKTYQLGAIWYNDKVSLDSDFEGTYYVYLGNQGTSAADGMTFTLQNDPRGLDAIGRGGGFLGAFGLTDAEDSIAVKPAISVEFDLYMNNSQWDSYLDKDVKPNNNYGHVATMIPDNNSQNAVMQHYNVQYPTVPLSNGQWRQFWLKWDSVNKLFTYTFSQYNTTTDKWESLPGGEQKIVFGSTSDIPALRKSPEEYFGGSSVYWGFTGATGAKYAEQILALDAPFNQSQSPLQLSMTKLGEIGSDGVRQPLAGAKFILQAQKADETWRQFNPEKATKDVAEVFTTDADGKIVIKATDNQKHADLIDLVLKYGGLEDYQAFRFREVQAAPNPDPTGDAYLEPPAIDAANPTNYAASEPENSAALFTTKSVKLSGASTTPTDPTEENPDDGDFGTVFNSVDTWLPYYKPGLGIDNGGWLDSMESYVPRKNAFVMRYLTGKTEVDKSKSSSNIIYHPESDSGLVSFDFDQGPGIVWIGNVGFYNGHPLDVKVTMTVESNQTYAQLKAEIPDIDTLFGLNTKSNEIDWNGKKVDQFLGIYNHFKFNSFNIHYELYDEQGEEVHLGAYQTYDALDEKKILTLQKNDFENIYSVSREYTEDGTLKPILLKYTNESDQLVIRSNDMIAGKKGILQNQFTATIKDLSGSGFTTYDSQLGYDTDTRYQVWYIPETPVKVEIPEPQAVTKIYTKILANGQGILEDKKIENMTYGFYQSIPWESTSPRNNRTQTPEWLLTPPATNNTFTTSAWQVESLDDPDLGGGNLSTWFPIVDNKVTPPSSKLIEDEFYNHYYHFNRNLTLNLNQPIARNDLISKNDGYYFTYEGQVKLEVEDSSPTIEQEVGMNNDRQDVDYVTAINFYAPIDYKYVNSITGEEIPTSKLPTVAKPTGDGIVTWDAPLTPQMLTDPSYTQTTGQGDAPTVTGYVFDHGELNGEEETQIKVTKLLRPETLKEKALGRAVDATDPANYTQNNIVTLYYTPVSYDVEIEVTKPNGDTLETNANSYFEISNDNGETWVTVSGYDFAAGNTYKIRQKEVVNQYYTKAGESPAFTVEVDAEGNFTLTATDGDGYSFIRTELVDKKLKIKVINQPSGGIVLSQVEPLDYGTVQMPRKDMTINRVDPDWKIDFEDNRPPEDDNKLYFYVTLTKEFTDQDGAGAKTLPGILAFINEPGEITANDFLVKDTQMPIQTITRPQYGADSLQWSADAGFLLQLDKKTEAKLNVGQDQKYQAELTFTLAEDPL